VTGPDTHKHQTTADKNPTIVNPPSCGNPPVTSEETPATKGNMQTECHPKAAGPHPPADATHKKETLVPLPNPISSSSTAPTNRLIKLEKAQLSEITKMLSYSYSGPNSLIVLPTTEDDDAHSLHQQQNTSTDTTSTGETKLAKDLKKEQHQLEKLNHRRDYIFKKIARALMKRGEAWGLYDNTHTHIVAAALMIPPACGSSQNPNELRLEDPNINVGRADHYLPLAKIFTKKNPKQMLMFGPSLIKRIRLELRLFDTAMTIHQRPDCSFLYFFGDVKLGQNSDSHGTANQSKIQHENPMPVLAENDTFGSNNVNILLEELGRRYPMQVIAQRYRDDRRFLMLLQNGFQEIDKVQGFHQRGAEGEAHVYAPGVGSKQIAHGREGPDLIYESCFITLIKGFYPSLKNVENDLRGIVAQKQADGIISDPTTVLPPAHLPNKHPETTETIRPPPPPHS
jgi:hypothetical protein